MSDTNSLDSKNSTGSKKSTSSKNSTSSGKSTSSRKSTSSTGSKKGKKKVKKVVRTILTKRGYTLVKKYFTFRELHKLKKDLTVSAYVNENYAAKPSPFPIFMESLNKLYIPRHYGIEHFGEPDRVKLSNKVVKIDLKFNGTLRDKQKIPVQKFLDSCKKGSYTTRSRGGILTLPCGFGKTILTLNIIAQLGVKTLIIVHKEFLVDQWVDRIKHFLPEARIGIIQQKKVKIQDKDIVIAMLQSISMRNYDSDVFESFGLCCSDECHHLSSEVFSRALPKIGCKYNLGLSATPTRKDGLTKVFLWYLGPFIHKITKRDEAELDVRIIDYLSDNGNLVREELTFMGKICSSKMINNICYYPKRARFLVKVIFDILKDERRNVIVLSDRIKHLEMIYHYITKTGFEDVSFYIGGMKRVDRELAEKKRLILSTWAMSKEGLDLPKLNTMILSSPKSEITQAIGRILRKKHEVVPLVIDIVDKNINDPNTAFSCFTKQSFKRLRFYNKCKYNIYKIEVTDTEKTKTKEMLKQYKKGILEAKNLKKVPKTKLKKNKKKEIPKGVCLIDSDSD